MDQEFRQDVPFKPWGPLISPAYKQEPITIADIITASVVWALTLVNVIVALWQILAQTKGSRAPWRSVYIWMIWLELIVSFFMGLECFLHLLKYIPPSFAFYFTTLFWWCIQVQLLLQIIINRIRVIVPDRRRSANIMIATAVFVTTTNISVFCIWIPARLQISDRYHVINKYWDRIEKTLYLLVDALLNWYFLKTVKANLVSNGLTKYDKLVRFNQRIIWLSLLMDVMTIVAMSIPNSFVYIQFHPLAYLVKLNIELTNANLIKRIALSTYKRSGQHTFSNEFKSSSTDTNPTLIRIETTREVTVTSERDPRFGHGRRGSEVEITGGRERGRSFECKVVMVEERGELENGGKRDGEGEGDDEVGLVGKEGKI